MLVFPDSTTNQEDSELLQPTINWQFELPQCRSSPMDFAHINSRSLPSRNSNMSLCSTQIEEALHDEQERQDILTKYACSSPLEFHDFFPINTENISNCNINYESSNNATTVVPSIIHASPANSECTNSATEFRSVSFPSRVCYHHPFQQQQYLLYRDNISTSVSSIPTSEDSTPLAYGMTNNSRADQFNTKSSLLTADWSMGDKPDSEDELFNHHMEMLMEYSLSPKTPSQYHGDCWLKYPPLEIPLQNHAKMEFPLHAGSFASTSLMSSSHGFPSRVSMEKPSPFSMTTANPQCFMPWFRSINRNAVFNQQNILPEPLQNRQNFLGQHQAYSRPNNAKRKTRVEEKQVRGTGENSTHKTAASQNKDGPERTNSEEDSEYADDDETQQGDDEIGDSEEDGEDWLSSFSSRKRKDEKKEYSCPKKARKSSDQAEIDLETADNSPSKPRRKARRKASEAARNILMNWLVENEDHPYPTKKQKLDLANATGLSLKQIVHWLSNIRKRRMIPLLSGRRQASSMVDMKFLEDLYQRRNMRISQK